MLSGLVFVAMLPMTAAGANSSPATGYEIHVQAPHMMPDGTPGGPYHHYCKGISDQILQCLLFESTNRKVPLSQSNILCRKISPENFRPSSGIDISMTTRWRLQRDGSRFSICRRTKPRRSRKPHPKPTE